MTLKLKACYDSSIAPAIDFELAFGGIWSYQADMNDLEAIQLLDTLNPDLKLDRSLIMA